MTLMRTLLLQLPITPAGPQAVYGQAWVDPTEGSRVQAGFAPLPLLPAVERRTPVVAIVPAAALSWHRITLPAGLTRQSAKLQAAVLGLLEDRLLQEPAQVHIALPTQWQAGAPLWVAVCDKAWLTAHLQSLDAAQIPVQRLVPELAPPEQGESWLAVGNEDSGWLWQCSAQSGVTGWPVTAIGQMPGATPTTVRVQAEPALASWAQKLWPQQVQLVDAASHWPAALATDWDLAQFELASRLRQRHWLRWRQRLDRLLRHPQWRPARWGLVALVLAQLFGLNAWAWMTRQQWQAQQDAWTAMLQESFPKVTVVLDAPLQMAREVARLRQGSGQLTASDFESQLQALGAALPSGVGSPARLNYRDGVLQWPALTLSAAQKAALEQALVQQGYTLQSQGDQWQMQSREARP